jgi:hypothetical protein
MTNKELVNRNIGLTFDLIRKIIENPELIDKIPDHCIIEFPRAHSPLLCGGVSGQKNKKTIGNRRFLAACREELQFVEKDFEAREKVTDENRKLIKVRNEIEIY